MTDRLAVWLGDGIAGALERTARGRLVYVPERDAPSISVGVTTTDAWTSERTEAWFEGLLPEGEARSWVAGRFGIRASDTFALLTEIGWECAGAVALLPEGRRPATGTYRPLTDEEVGLRLDALPGRPYDDDRALRVSLGGIQSKLVLARIDGHWAEPLDGAPSTHILKPEPAVWPGLAAAEVWAMQVAARATAAADVELAPGPGERPTVIVTRFDRVQSGDAITRRHQEDLCQVLGLPPEAKYAEPPPKPWKPSLERLARVVVERAPDPTAELVRLLVQTTVNVALVNADAHAKNHSILHGPGGTATLAPMYDIVTTGLFLRSQTWAALPVGGRYRIDEIGRDHLVREGVSWGIPERIATRAVIDTLGHLAVAIEEVTPVGVDAVRPVVDRQLRRLRASD